MGDILVELIQEQIKREEKMARINLKFTKDTDSDGNRRFYFNCEESDETTFKAA